eukprot:8207618-Pyramimonas_sp.AAC.1
MVWLCGSPLVTCELDFDGDSAKAWLAANEALGNLNNAVKSIFRTFEGTSGMQFADQDPGTIRRRR